MSDTPAKPAFDAVADATLKLAKDIPVVARQNIGARIDFFPFNAWEKEVLAPEKHIYDEEGRCYRYDLWSGQLSFARTQEDVKGERDSDWPVHMAPREGSPRWRRRHVMEVMRRDMGCRRAMSRGMQDVAMCHALASLAGDHYVVKAQRSVLYFQNLGTAFDATIDAAVKDG